MRENDYLAVKGIAWRKRETEFAAAAPITRLPSSNMSQIDNLKWLAHVGPCNHVKWHFLIKGNNSSTALHNVHALNGSGPKNAKANLSASYSVIFETIFEDSRYRGILLFWKAFKKA